MKQIILEKNLLQAYLKYAFHIQIRLLKHFFYYQFILKILLPHQ